MTRRGPLVIGLAVTAPAVALLVGVTTGAVTAASPAGLPDPGWSSRIGTPVAQAARDVAAMVTVGCVFLAACCVAPADKRSGDLVTGARARLTAIVLIAASSWALLNLTLVALTFSDASGQAIGSAGFAEQAWFFARSYEVGQYLLWGAALAAAVAVTCVRVRRVGGLGLAAVLSVAALWPTALTGHAAGSLRHDDAVNLQMVHLVAVAVWAGGLLALVIVARGLGPRLPDTVRRYSTTAAWCLALVAASGVLGAALRLQRVDALLSTYGAVVLLKSGLLVAAAGLGWWQRRRLVARLEEGRQHAFVRLVVLEVGVLLAGAGAGVALSRTETPEPPGGVRPLTPAEDLLGRSLPPPLDASEWFTGWTIDSLWLPAGLAAIAWYVAAVLRLRRRGDRWSGLRTACWVLGWLLMIWATSGAPGTYGRVLFSMHMVQHMTIATAVPVFLVLGTPVTLALRTTRRRTDGSSGPREWLLRLVHSVPAALLGHPLVAATLFVVGMVGFYYSSAFETSLESHTAHLLMTVHFLITGYLFAECIVGADPGLERPAYPLRALLLMVTFAFHALFSVSLMASDQVLANRWFEALQRSWGPSLLGDQKTGAGIGWVMGEYPLVVMGVALLVAWVGADRRERRRFDRLEERHGDRELIRYNNYLAALGRQRPAGSSRPSGPAAVEGPASEEEATGQHRHR